MLEIKDIKELFEMLKDSPIEHFEYEKEGQRLVLKKPSSAFFDMTRSAEPAPYIAPQLAVQPMPHEVQAAATNPEPAEAIVECTTKQILSPMVGTFYSASSPEAAPFVQVGDRVNAKKIVCIVEAMKLFNEIEAEVDGEIMEILVTNGQLVEYGQPLFTVKVQE